MGDYENVWRYFRCSEVIMRRLTLLSEMEINSETLKVNVDLRKGFDITLAV